MLYSSPMRRFVLVLALSSGACRGAESPPPLGGAGETCKMGEHVVRECEGALRCVPRTYSVSQAPSGVHGPQVASDIGGVCGGVAGFHCAEGLECQLPPDQTTAADGMGSCVRVSQCVR
jgi:hypothetical protein